MIEAPYKQAILAALDVIPEICLALVFGSIANATQQQDSDIDLAVHANRRLESSERMMLIEALAQRTGRPVDLVDLRCAGEPLLGQILKNGVLIRGTRQQLV